MYAKTYMQRLVKDIQIFCYDQLIKGESSILTFSANLFKNIASLK